MQVGQQFGQSNVKRDYVNMGMVSQNLDQSIYMGLTWRILMVAGRRLGAWAETEG